MAKIDRAEDLPDWFDLEKYQEVESFGAVEWFECLYWRQSKLYESPYFFGKDPESADTMEALESWRIRFEHNRGNLKLLREDPLRTDFGPEWTRPSSWLFHPGNQPVRPITSFDLMSQATYDRFHTESSSDGNARLLRWEALGASGPWPENCEMDTKLEFEWNGRDVYSPDAALYVDMRATDAVLKKAFDAWLKSARDHRKGMDRRRKTPLYDRWGRYGLLPYLDLVIWSLETNTHIPDRVMSAAISRYDAGEANLRKTIAPLALGLMRDMAELEGLALIEAAGKGRDGAETYES